jgi:pilus assembly protein Flp/PilA
MMFRLWRKLRNHEIGATAIEYGLIAGLVSVVIITGLEMANSSMIAVFDYISTNVVEGLR